MARPRERTVTIKIPAFTIEVPHRLIREAWVDENELREWDSKLTLKKAIREIERADSLVDRLDDFLAYNEDVVTEWISEELRCL